MNSSRNPYILILLVLLFIVVPVITLSVAAPITSLQQAYNQANNSDIIRVHNASFSEELLLNRSIEITFDGGYTDSTYSGKSGVTSLLGTLTIGDGTLTIADFAVDSGASGGSPPVIGSISVAAPDIAWTTDQPATSRVDYGETTAYGSTVTSAALATSHSLTLTGLQATTTYHYRIVTSNSAGQTSTTADATFVTPAFVVAPLSDLGAVTVMEASGSFDTINPDSSPNTAPRQEIASRFIRDHGDSYDFLVILTTFPVTMPTTTTKGLYTAVKSDTLGLGQSLFNHGSNFGSAGKLQGVIDMGDISPLVSEPNAANLDEKLTVMAHELLHRWGAYVRYLQGGSTSTALLGEAGSHWSYLLDSQASVMYGNAWIDNNNGTFTSSSIWNSYSALDLYLMGMIPKTEVQPMILITNLAIDPSTQSLAGATISGTASTVSIDDIVAVEGDRSPTSAQAQKEFKIGYILLTRPGVATGNAPAITETLGSAFAGRFAQLTNGAGKVLDVAPSLNVAMTAPASGASVVGPDVTVQGTIINSTGAETGVTINGLPSTVNGSSFVANHVSLQEGSNSIVITATDVNGLTTTTTTVLTGVAGNYIRVQSNSESGLAPLDITLTIDGSFGITNSELYFSGPADIELTAAPTTTEYPLRFPVEGTYTLTAYVTGSDELEYESELTITVLSILGLDRLLKQKWEGMKSALAANNVSNAISFFNEPSQGKYQEIFQELSGSLPGIAADMEPIELDYAQQDVAEYRITRMEDIGGQPQEISYFIYFVKDKDGLWKLNQM
jgi:hypothetical protein